MPRDAKTLIASWMTTLLTLYRATSSGSDGNGLPGRNRSEMRSPMQSRTIASLSRNRLKSAVASVKGPPTGSLTAEQYTANEGVERQPRCARHRAQSAAVDYSRDADLCPPAVTSVSRARNRAPVAQRTEHLTSDQMVGGSNPSGRAIPTRASNDATSARYSSVRASHAPSGCRGRVRRRIATERSRSAPPVWPLTRVRPDR